MPRVSSGDWIDADTYADEEDPGAGAQTFDAAGLAGTGANGWRVRVWKALTQFFSGYGTVASDKIDGNAIKASAVDGSTLETNNPTGAKMLRVKDAGITAAKLASDAVTTVKILDANVTAAKLASDSVTNVKIADNAVNTQKLNAQAVTPNKMSHDNNARKLMISFSIGAQDEYAYIGGVKMTASVQLLLPRAGYITKVILCRGTGAVVSGTAAYGTAGNSFAAGAKLGIAQESGGRTLQVTVNGTPIAMTALDTGTTAPFIGCLEVEFDD